MSLHPAGENHHAQGQIMLFEIQAKKLTPILTTEAHLGHDLLMNRAGTKLGFTAAGAVVSGRDLDGNPEVFLYDTVSENLTQVTETAQCDNMNPFINGMGTQIVFGSNCMIDGRNGDRNFEIFVYNLKTGGFTQITDSIFMFNHTPSLDATGTRIAFGSDRDLHPGGNMDLNSEIFLAAWPER